MSIYTLEQDGDTVELLRLLDESGSPAVRRRASEALGEVALEDDAALDALIRVAADDGDPDVRAAAVDAVDDIGARAIRRLLAAMATRELGPGSAIPSDVLADTMDAEMPEVRMAAASAIGHDEATEAVPALLAGLGDPDARVRVRAVRATGRVGDERAVEPLSKLARKAPPGAREDIATALGEIGGEDALAALDPLMEDDSADVRRAAIRALGQFEECRPVGRVVDRLTDEDDELRRAAARAIVDLLSNAPTNDSHELRTAVVEALSTSHEGAVLEALVELFEESSDAVRRRNAAWLLGRVSDGGAAAIETLAAGLDDDDETVRRFAATSLVEMGSPAVEEALLDALGSTFGDGRTMLIYVLGKVGTERARERLLELLDEVENSAVQERTIAALSRLGGTLVDGGSPPDCAGVEP